MIVYNLVCGQDHGFEAWFKDARAYAGQRRARKIVCPVCGDTGIVKVPAGSRISRGHAQAMERSAKVMAAAGAQYGKLREAVAELQAHVEANCENVGPRFAEEARKIHYGEAEERGIYGEATETEASELADEGVPFARLPVLPESDA
jgi:hypothetical protein